ncbi:MAG: hypothetical protein ACREEM_40375 [Blastocatellia bacterium]
MERNDVAAVCRLLDKVFGNRNPIYPNWQEVIEWLYFSPAIKDQIPRAFVIADGCSVVGHIGLTLSEFTNGDKSFNVVQTANWVVDPDSKTGLLSLRLVQEAVSFGDAAIVIGGTEHTQRIIPRIGFKRRLEVDRYIKIIKPLKYLSMSRSGERLMKNLGKLTMFLAHSPQRLFQASGGQASGGQASGGQASGGQASGGQANGGNPASPASRRVFRNSLRPDFLNWYQQCPQGEVHTFEIHGGSTTVMGQATVLLRSSKGNRYANLVNVDAPVDDPLVWSNILDAAERFLSEKGVTHINTLASFGPFRQALEEKGYCKVNRLPFWIRDKNSRLDGVEAWHLTAIEGDLGYLFE